MRKIFKYIYLLPLFLIASCTFSEGLSLDEVLKVSNTTFEFDKSANSQTLEIESYCSWDLKCDASWVTFSVTKRGEGKVKNTLSVIENESPIARSAVAEIYNEDYGVSVKINITQGASAPYIECSKDTISVSYINKTEKIEVVSNIPWEASTDAEWIEISPKSGLSGVTTMTINVNMNTSAESREGIITLKNEEYSLTVYVNIQQNKWEPNSLESVDLGLPSGLKWATCNVGASSPEEYGDYYAWGEVETKSEYTHDNSKTYGKSMSDISGNAMYDVACAKWGGSWRLPTNKEMEELIDECKWKWTTQNGIKGYTVTGPNGNSIFLPAAGYRLGSSLYYAGENGYYWSSTPLESDGYGAYDLSFRRSDHDVGWDGRYYGQSVRPVSE